MSRGAATAQRHHFLQNWPQLVDNLDKTLTTLKNIEKYWKHWQNIGGWSTILAKHCICTVFVSSTNKTTNIETAVLCISQLVDDHYKTLNNNISCATFKLTIATQDIRKSQVTTRVKRYCSKQISFKDKIFAEKRLADLVGPSPFYGWNSWSPIFWASLRERAILKGAHWGVWCLSWVWTVCERKGFTEQSKQATLQTWWSVHM